MLEMAREYGREFEKHGPAPPGITRFCVPCILCALLRGDGLSHLEAVLYLPVHKLILPSVRQHLATRTHTHHTTFAPSYHFQIVKKRLTLFPEHGDKL